MIPLECTLSGDAQTARFAEWADLLTRTTGKTDADGGADVTFPADPDLAGQLAALAMREKECCSFFAFTLDMTAAASITLHVRAPQGAEPLVAACWASHESKGGRFAVPGAAGACTACCVAPISASASSPATASPSANSQAGSHSTERFAQTSDGRNAKSKPLRGRGPLWTNCEALSRTYGSEGCL